MSAAQLNDLHREGYAAVINLMPDSESPVPDEERIVRDQGLDYVYIPVDFNEPARADLEAFVEAMDARAGEKVHVHCAANYRVTAFYSLYALRRGLPTTRKRTSSCRASGTPPSFLFGWRSSRTNGASGFVGDADPARGVSARER